MASQTKLHMLTWQHPPPQGMALLSWWPQCQPGASGEDTQCRAHKGGSILQKLPGARSGKKSQCNSGLRAFSLHMGWSRSQLPSLYSADGKWRTGKHRSEGGFTHTMLPSSRLEEALVAVIRLFAALTASLRGGSFPAHGCRLSNRGATSQSKLHSTWLLALCSFCDSKSWTSWVLWFHFPVSLILWVEYQRSVFTAWHWGLVFCGLWDAQGHVGAFGDAGTDGLALEDCVGTRLGTGSARRAFGMSPGIKWALKYTQGQFCRGIVGATRT